MTCKECEELINKYFDEELSVEEIVLLHEHLNKCSSCKEMFSFCEYLPSVTKEGYDFVAPQSLVERILTRINEPSEEKDSKVAPMFTQQQPPQRTQVPTIIPTSTSPQGPKKEESEEEKKRKTLLPPLRPVPTTPTTTIPKVPIPPHTTSTTFPPVSRVPFPRYIANQLIKNRSIVFSMGAHALLLLLLFKTVIMRPEIKTPEFVARVISQQQIVNQRIMPQVRQEKEAGLEGLEGLKGGGSSPSLIKEKFMVKPEMQHTSIDKIFKPVANLRTTIRDIFVPQKVMSVDNSRIKSRFSVARMDQSSFDRNVPMSGYQVGQLSRPRGEKDSTGLYVYGTDNVSGRPDGNQLGSGIGLDKGGNTGTGGGGGAGWTFGSGTGSGNRGNGPGSGSSGLGAGSGPGFGPGSGAGTPGIPIGGSAVPPPTPIPGPITPPSPGLPQLPGGPGPAPIFQKPPIGTPENPVMGLDLAVEFNGEACYNHVFGMSFPEDKVLIRNPKIARSEIVRCGPYTTRPSEFIFYLYVDPTPCVPNKQPYTLYTDRDRQYVRIERITEDTYRLWWEDIKPLEEGDRDFDDVIITVHFKGKYQ